MTPEASVRARKTPQSTSPQAVSAALAEVNGWLRGVLARRSRLAVPRNRFPAIKVFFGRFMQQRQLRLGDILDDYCPRERRLANHTIVAMVGDDIRLTRCTTCDTEHPYKGGKAPRLRKKKTSVEAAYDEVLESVKHDAQPPGILVTHRTRRTGTRARHRSSRRTRRRLARCNSDNGNAPAETAPEEVRLHRPLDPCAAAAHRARAGGAASARVHHPPGEQEPRPIPEQLAPRALCERRGGQGGNSRGHGRPPGTARRRPAAGARRVADASAAGTAQHSGTEEAVAVDRPIRKSRIDNLTSTI